MGACNFIVRFGTEDAPQRAAVVGADPRARGSPRWEQHMLSRDDMEKSREEREVLDRWRKYSCHIVADLLEVCEVCSTVREKDRLARCRLCGDAYYCKNGVCSHDHYAHIHRLDGVWIR
jgi:hypothetical protein